MLSKGFATVGLLLVSNVFMTLANRIGFEGNGGPFSLIQLKIIQEVITLTVFTLFSVIAFQQHLAWNHFAAFACLVAAVYFVFMK